MVEPIGEAVPPGRIEHVEEGLRFLQRRAGTVDWERRVPPHQPDLFEQEGVARDMVRVLVREDEGVERDRVDPSHLQLLHRVAAAVDEDRVAAALDGEHGGGAVGAAVSGAGAEKVDGHRRRGENGGYPTRHDGVPASAPRAIAYSRSR